MPGIFGEFLRTLAEGVVWIITGGSFGGLFGIVEPSEGREGLGGEFEKTGGGRAFGEFKGLPTGP